MADRDDAAPLSTLVRSRWGRIAQTAATRALSEASATAALWRSGAVGVDLPHRMLPAAGALLRQGPVGAALALPVGRFPDRVAVVDERGPVTFTELATLAQRLATTLADRGVGSDDTIAVMCRNHPRWPAASRSTA